MIVRALAVSAVLAACGSKPAPAPSAPTVEAPRDPAPAPATPPAPVVSAIDKAGMDLQVKPGDSECDCVSNVAAVAVSSPRAWR
jgi:hypothetical protein